MKKKTLLILLPLILGIIIYISFRSKSLFYFQIFHYFDFHEEVLAIRKFAFSHRKLIPNWVIYSLPDGLWLFSFGIAILYYLDNYTKRVILFTLITIVTLCFEYIQYSFGGHGTLIGTYDKWDLYCFLGAYISAIFISKIRTLKYSNRDMFFKKSFRVILKEEALTIIFFILLSMLPTLFT